MVSDELKVLKERSRKKNRDISEETGIPESTVSRIIGGQTDNPSYANVRDIVQCLGGSLDEIAGIQTDKEQDYCTQMQEYEQEIEQLRNAIDIKGKWILRLFTIACAESIVIIVIVVFIAIAHTTGII